MTGHDVVVVGARAAGAPTAMLLARAGLRVALVDRGRYGSDTVSTHGLMRAGVLQLSRWGLLDEVVASGAPPVRHTTFHYADRPDDPDDPVRVSVRPSPGVPALFAPRRRVLDRILVDAAARAGAAVRHGVAVTELLRDGTGRVRGVRTEGAQGREDLPARFVVGADGIGSRVARQTGAPVLRRGRSGSAVRYAYVPAPGAAGYEWAYGAHAAAGLIPTHDDLACVFVATTPARMRGLTRTGSPVGAMATLLEEAAPALVDRVDLSRRVGPVRGWGGVPGFVRRSWGPGWALVGDAAYFKDPISTHGITDALRDAELLADAVWQALSGARPEGAALEEYRTGRDALSEHLFTVSDEIAGYGWRGGEAQPLLRRLSAAMTDEVEALQARPALDRTADALAADPVAADPVEADSVAWQR